MRGISMSGHHEIQLGASLLERGPGIGTIDHHRDIVLRGVQHALHQGSAVVIESSITRRRLRAGGPGSPRSQTRASRDQSARRASLSNPGARQESALSIHPA